MDTFCFNTIVHEFDSSIHGLNSKFTPNSAIFNHKNDDLTADVASMRVYHDPTSFDDNFLFANSISCMHINFRSMAKNVASFIDMFNTPHCLSDILIISETWLTENDSDMFKINDYSQISVP